LNIKYIYIDIKSLITGKIPLTPSKIPWRREGIKYGGNEMFLDLNEEINIVQDW